MSQLATYTGHKDSSLSLADSSAGFLMSQYTCDYECLRCSHFKPAREVGGSSFLACFFSHSNLWRQRWGVKKGFGVPYNSDPSVYFSLLSQRQKLQVLDWGFCNFFFFSKHMFILSTWRHTEKINTHRGKKQKEREGEKQKKYRKWMRNI